MRLPISSSLNSAPCVPTGASGGSCASRLAIRSCSAWDSAARCCSSCSRADPRPTAPAVPPNGALIKAAWYADSPYALIASGEVKSCPDWYLLIISCPTSTGISTIPRAAPRPAEAASERSAALTNSACALAVWMAASSATPRIPLTTRLPNVKAVPALSSAAIPAAAVYAFVRSILTGSPFSICSAAWVSTVCPINCGKSVAPAPNTPPTIVPAPGATAVPSAAPVLAPPYIRAKLAACPANARGICDGSSLAAPSRPSFS